MTVFDPEMPDFNPEPLDVFVGFPIEADIIYAYECRVARGETGVWSCSHGHGSETTWEAAVKVCLDHEPEGAPCL